MKLNSNLLRRGRPWQTSTKLILFLLPALLVGQDYHSERVQDFIQFSSPAFFPGSTPTRIKAVFEIGPTNHSMSQMRVNSVTLTQTEGGPATPIRPLQSPFPYAMTRSNQESLDEHYFEVEYEVGSIRAGAKAKLELFASFLFKGRKFNSRFESPILDLPGNGNEGTLIMNPTIEDASQPGGNRSLNQKDRAEFDAELNKSYQLRLNADGKISATLAPGRYFFEMSIAGYTAAEGITIEKGKITSVDALLTESEPRSMPYVVFSPDCVENILSADFQKFRLRSTSYAKPWQIKDFANLTVDYQNAQGNQGAIIQDAFQVDPDGTLTATKIEALRKIFVQEAKGAKGGFLTISGTLDGNYFQYRFRIGSRRIRGKLKPPPSLPGLAVGNRSVIVQLAEDEVNFEAITKPDGSFELPVLVPDKQTALLSVTVIANNGNYYRGSAGFLTFKDQNVEVTLLGPEDDNARVTPFVLLDM
jgi:hypothetical protein